MSRATRSATRCYKFCYTHSPRQYWAATLATPLTRARVRVRARSRARVPARVNTHVASVASVVSFKNQQVKEGEKCSRTCSTPCRHVASPGFPIFSDPEQAVIHMRQRADGSHTPWCIIRHPAGWQIMPVSAADQAGLPYSVRYAPRESSGESNMDEIDIANDRIQREIDSIVAARRQIVQHDCPAAEACDECGEPIPEERRQAVPGTRLCVDCARRAERFAT